MTAAHRSTLTQYLIEERRRFPQARGDLNALILDVSIACKAISRAVALGELDRGESAKPVGALSNDMFLRRNEWSGVLAGMASEAMDAPYPIPRHYPRGKYLLVFDPLDGSGNLDVNVSVGSIFSILRAPQDVVDSGRDVTAEDFLQAGSAQVAAGYALYGPSTMLVLTVRNGVAGFTLDPNVGEFMLTHPSIRIGEDTHEFAINASNSRFWEPPVKRYVEECLAGATGPRGKDFNMRWIASMVAEAHRILLRGGVFMDPRDSRAADVPDKPGRLRLLHEANPIGLVIEQAGGRCSTGRQPMLGVAPSSLHQRIGAIFGSRHEVERIERYHHETLSHDAATTPLFAERGLFRNAY